MVVSGFQRFQCHVHTYRILPDADGLLAVQVSVLILSQMRLNDLPEKRKIKE